MDTYQKIIFSRTADFNTEYENPLQISETAPTANGAVKTESLGKFKGFIIAAVIVNFLILIVTVACVSYLLATMRADYDNVAQQVGMTKTGITIQPKFAILKILSLLWLIRGVFPCITEEK